MKTRSKRSAAQNADPNQIELQFPDSPKEFKIVALRECPQKNALGDNPDSIAKYWRRNIATADYYNPHVESFFVVLLNIKRRVIGHHLVAVGTLDTVSIHTRETFRAAIIGAASAIVMMHNHPSGNPVPSDADINATRQMIRSGQLLQIPVLDHIIVGATKHTSLRAINFDMWKGCE